uniref:Uncharacterized protein n=1 Tax=Octopus bimaculoides TaxID=37653 RepID=A0A0L8FY59_OCTBM
MENEYEKMMLEQQIHNQRHSDIYRCTTYRWRDLNSVLKKNEPIYCTVIIYNANELLAVSFTLL